MGNSAHRFRKKNININNDFSCYEELLITDLMARID
ncbi:MAG: hypothetical protein JWQ25_1851 [Daejeonella sp.]|nr:hypothetical protein [Daejeonella sp.]